MGSQRSTSLQSGTRRTRLACRGAGQFSPSHLHREAYRRYGAGLEEVRTNASARTPDQIETCASEWVQSKFKADAKAKTRERLWPHVQWQYHLVHARVRERRELEVFQREGVACHSFRQLLADLSRRKDHSFSGSAGGD